MHGKAYYKELSFSFLFLYNSRDYIILVICYKEIMKSLCQDIPLFARVTQRISHRLPRPGKGGADVYSPLSAF